MMKVTFKQAQFSLKDFLLLAIFLISGFLFIGVTEVFAGPGCSAGYTCVLWQSEVQEICQYEAWPICLECHTCKKDEDDSGSGSCPSSPMKDRECCLGNTFWCDDPEDEDPVITYTLQLNKSGNGTGTVTSSPSGISCGASCSSASTSRVGSSLWTLTASASSGSTFAGWSQPQYSYCTDSGKSGCNSYANTCGKLSSCRVMANSGSTKVVVATFTRPTITAALAVSPTSGTTQTTFTFTPSRTGGTATGTVTYSNPQCGTGGTRTSWTSSTGRFTCTYSSAGAKTARVTLTQGGATATPTRPVNVGATTVTASLAVSPTSGTTQTTYAFTPSRTGGTATGTIVYSNPSCGTGGTATGFSATTGRFNCTYSSAGTKTASVRISQGGATATPTRSVSVGATTITAALAVSPTSGTTQTTYAFTPSRTGGTATGTITYSNPQCGTGGTATGFSATTGRFNCTYISAGTKTASVTASQGGASATPTRSVTVSTPTIEASLAVNKTSGFVGDSFTFTASRTSGTATGAITYTNPQCGTGGTLSGYTGNTDTTFVCEYTSTGSKSARMTVSQGGVSSTATRAINIDHNPPEITSFGAYPSTVEYGGSTRIRWSSDNTERCVSRSGYTYFNTNDATSNMTGVLVSNLMAHTTYGLSCLGLNGDWVYAGPTTVRVKAEEPDIDFSADPTWVRAGGETTISWNVENATSCKLTKGASEVLSSLVSGSVTDQVSVPSTYTLSCVNNPGSGLDSSDPVERTLSVYILPIYGEF